MKIIKLIFLFAIIFLAYFLIGTHGTGKIGYDLDYYNPLARSFLSGHLDISNPIETHDLSQFKGKWYPYWGPIPAFLLIPFQLIMGRYVPAAYLSIFFGSLNIVLVWLIIKRVGHEYFENKLSFWFRFFLLIFFAFGTSHVYISGRSGVWFVSQTVSLFPYLLAFFILIKKKLSAKDFLLAAILIGLNFLNRTSLILLSGFMFLRLLDSQKDYVKKFLSIIFPLVFFAGLFMVYNYLRFGSILDTGVNYQNIAPFNPVELMPFGTFSWKYIPRNLWLVFLELPKENFKFNYEGMSIFFVSPLYLASVLSLWNRSRLVIQLWLGTVVLMIPTLLLFSPGLFQFGIRYSLDFGILLLVLGIFGLRGKISVFMVLAVAMAVILNIYSTFIL